MDKAEKFYYYPKSLCVYNFDFFDKNDECTAFYYISSLFDGEESENLIENYSSLFKLVAPFGSLRKYISQLVLCNDNIFTRAAAANKADSLSRPVLDAVKSDLKKLEFIASLTTDDVIDFAPEYEKELLFSMPRWETGNGVFPLTENRADKIDGLIEFHRTHGYGEYVKYAAFTGRQGKIEPIKSAAEITLDELKNYDRQKQLVLDNTSAFLEGYPANNILLYGDRGTGKSSLVHAVLNKFKNRGLRMIEISKSDISFLNRIRESIADSPMKFIIFIDDLSFDSHEDSFAELKAALEGSLSGRKSNTLIYATSNRRHLIKENFSDRENDIHRNDTMQEELSLSDRFGLSIYFENPDRKNYLDITEKIARDRGLDVDYAELLRKAEIWASRKGGRSPRGARQFVDYVTSCIKRNIKW